MRLLGRSWSALGGSWVLVVALGAALLAALGALLLAPGAPWADTKVVAPTRGDPDDQTNRTNRT